MPEHTFKVRLHTAICLSDFARCNKLSIILSRDFYHDSHDFSFVVELLEILCTQKANLREDGRYKDPGLRGWQETIYTNRYTEGLFQLNVQIAVRQRKANNHFSKSARQIAACKRILKIIFKPERHSGIAIGNAFIPLASLSLLQNRFSMCQLY